MYIYTLSVSVCSSMCMNNIPKFSFDWVTIVGIVPVHTTIQNVVFLIYIKDWSLFVCTSGYVRAGIILTVMTYPPKNQIKFDKSLIYVSIQCKTSQWCQTLVIILSSKTLIDYHSGLLYLVPDSIATSVGRSLLSCLWCCWSLSYQTPSLLASVMLPMNDVGGLPPFL